MYNQYQPLIREAWNERVLACLNEGRLGPGKYVSDFEDAIASKYGFKHVITVNSGTTALLLAFKIIQDTIGTYKLNVIAPAYSFLAGHNAAAFLGHDIHLHDVYYNNGCLQDNRLDDAIKKHKARVVLYINHNADNDDNHLHEVLDICRRNHCFLIEDSSQGINVKYHGRNQYLGSIGDIGILSFSVPKLLTTGQGGAILINNDGFADMARRLRDHGGGKWRQTRIHEAIGGNFRMTDPQAAYGLAQLEEIEELFKQRSNIHGWYSQYLPGYLSESHSWMCITDTSKIRDSYYDRDALNDILFDKGIECKRYYYPIHYNYPYKEDHTKFKTVYQVFSNHLFLPSSLSLTQDDVKTISKTLIDTLRNF